MKQWILSVGIIVLLTSIMSLILPEGKIGKFIKAMFSLITMTVIISPVIKLKNNDITIEDIYSEENFDFNNDILNYFHSKKIEECSYICNQILEKHGVKNAQITIKTINSIESFAVEKIFINLKNSVINSEKEHIDIIEQARIEISSRILIDKNNVIIVNE